MKKTPTLPKLTRPRSAQVLLRPRLFERLNAGRRIIWISAPAGAGKTTLVSSYIDEHKVHCLWYSIDVGDNDPASFFHYLGLAAKQVSPHYHKPLPALTPEFLPGLSIFALRYFEELYRRLKQPAVIVFDNCQEVSSQLLLQEILRTACESLPEGMRIVIASREDPPAAMARLLAHGELTLMVWDDLQLTMEESLSLASLRGSDADVPGSCERIQALHGICRGWAAGLSLLLEHPNLSADTPVVVNTSTRELLFGYFARELFDRTPATTQALLLKTAFLTHFDAKSVVSLTENAHTEQLLAELYRKNYFLMRREHPELVYEFHPLFREYLSAIAERSLSADATRALRLESASIIENSGSIEQAAELYCAAEDWPSLQRIILSHAQALISQGRHQTLEQWLQWLPDYDENGWLYYWVGVCRLPFDLMAARNGFEKAFALFEPSDDAAGVYLSWTGVCQTYIFEWRDVKPLDVWIDAIDRALVRFPVFPSREIEVLVHSMLIIMFYRQPRHPMLRAWTERGEALLQSCSDPALSIQLGYSLIIYSSLKGELQIAYRVMDALKRLQWIPEFSPLAHTLWCMMASLLAWQEGKHHVCSEYVTEGLQLASVTGVHINDSLSFAQGAYGCLVAGDLKKAEDYLRDLALSIPSLTYLQGSQYYFISALLAQQRGDFSKALEQSLIALNMGIEAGAPFPLALCNCVAAFSFFELGNEQKGTEHLEIARGIGFSIDSKAVEYLCLLTQARIALERNQMVQLRTHLSAAIALSRLSGGMILGWWGPEVMARLYTEALEGGIEVEYVQGIIRSTGLAPPAAGIIPEAWPIPISIYTLGRFEVVKDGNPLIFSGKAPKKPLDLLQCIIAFGGEGVSSDLLCDQLWPDADGDAAQRALVTTLHRLRQLLGQSECIVSNSGNISLNPRNVWVDVWAFERYSRQTDEIRKKGDETETRRLRQKAIDLYRGGFLNNQYCQKAVHRRNFLRADFLRHILAAGEDLENRGLVEEAIACYLQGLNTDTLEHVEILNQRLVRCYNKLDQSSNNLIPLHAGKLRGAGQ